VRRGTGGYDECVHWHHGLFFGWLFGFLFFVLLIALTVYAVSWLVGGRHGHLRAAGPAVPVPARDDPLAILRMRYARGEIGRDEFLRANEDLGAPPPATGSGSSAA
jgi:putative membrane protein